MHPLAGATQSPEHVAKRINSEGYKNRKPNPWNKGVVGLVPWNKGLKNSQVPWNKGLKGSQVAWNKGKEMSEEQRQKLSLAHKGQIPWQKGKHLNENQINALRNSNLGRAHSIETKRKMSLAQRGKRLGPKSNFWRGGINPLRMIIRDLAEATEWRMLVFRRDDFTCQYCDARGVHIEAHHLKRFTDIFREFLERHEMLSPVNDKYRLVELARKHVPFWDVNNGLTLCVGCHNKTKGV